MMELNIQLFASTNKTANYELPQFIGSDKPTWLGDFNEAMADIDAGMHENASDISAMASDVQTATATASQASQDVSGLTSTVNTLSSTVSSVQTTANNASQTASSALNTANTANGKADTNATNIATNTSDIASLNTSIDGLNDDLDELTTDVQLYGSHASSYTHNITLLDDAQKFREMIVITGIVVVVLSIKAKQKERIVWYILATAIAGLDSLMLLFYGAVSIFAFINLAIGIVFVVNKNASGKEEKDLEF